MTREKRLGLHEYTTVVSFKCPEGIRLALGKLSGIWRNVSMSDIIRFALEELLLKQGIDPYPDRYDKGKEV